MSMIKTIIRKPIRTVLPAHRQRAIQHHLRAIKMRNAPRAVVIGCGAIAPTHVSGFQKSGAAMVAAVSDINPLALTRAMSWPYIRPYFDHRQMLRETAPTLASVCTWPDSHYELVKELAAAGVRGIMCEKPLALRMDHVEAMLAACRSAGVRLAGGHQYRFHPNFIAARQAISARTLGKLRSVEGQIAGVLADNGPHLMDAVRFVLGDPAVVSVQCECTRNRPAFYQSLPVEEGSSGVITFDGGLRYSFRTGKEAQEYFAVRVEGDRGSLVITPARIEGVAAPPVTADRAFRNRQFREFVDWSLGRRSDYAADAEQSASAAEMVIACYESARQQKAVDLPLTNKGDVIRQLYAASPEAPAPAPLPPRARPAGKPDARTPAIYGGRRTMTGWFGTSAVVGAPEIIQLAKVVMGKNMNCVGGPQNKLLRQEFSRAYGGGTVVTSTSGTAAIHTALAAINPEPGDEVITTPITDMGSVIPILMCNCIPVFADVDPATGNLTAESIRAKITARTKAVILVHLFGQPADLDGITDLLKQRNIPLIEDCAQAHFAEYRGRKVGTFGDFGCFSFQQSKQITCGDGGVTIVNNDRYLERAELFVDKGWSRQFGRRHLLLGMNYRMTEMQAAVARQQLRRLGGFVERRCRTAAILQERLCNQTGILIPPETPQAAPSWWIYALGIDERALGVSTDEFCAALQFEGVRINRRYLDVPVFELEVIKEQNTYGTSRYPFSARSDYRPPRLEDYPGLMSFHNNKMIIPWSNRVQDKHAAQIAAAVCKLAEWYRAASGGSVE